MLLRISISNHLRLSLSSSPPSSGLGRRNVVAKFVNHPSPLNPSLRRRYANDNKEIISKGESDDKNSENKSPSEYKEKKKSAPLVPGHGEAPPLTTWRAKIQYGRALDWRVLALLMAAISAYVWYRFDDILARNKYQNVIELEHMLAGEMYKELIIKADEHLKDEPGWPEVLFLRGNAYFMLGQWEKSLGDFRVVIDGDTLHEAQRNTALILAARAFIEIRGNKEAIMCVDEALKKNPDSLMAWHTKATAQRNLGDYAGALISIDECIKLDPKETVALKFKTSLLLDRLNRPADALPIIKDAVNQDPYNLESRVDLIRALRMTGKYNESLKEIENSRSFGEHYLFYVEKANNLLELRRKDEALTALEHAAFINPGDVYLALRKETLKQELSGKR